MINSIRPRLATAAAAAAAGRTSTTAIRPVPLMAARSTSTSSSSSNTETHFGFRSVPESEKQRLVANVFSSVADSYDLMNDAMSLGIHRCWKNLYMDRLAPTQETRLLDVAGGTGDIAMRFLNYVKEHNGGQLGNAHVTVLDINPDMLRVGEERFKKMGYANDQHVTFIEGNAEVLEGIPDNSLDAYTIAFGIRNCTHIDRVIAQAHRVLKRGGRFMVLEFGKVNNPLLAATYDSYSFHMIPHLGQILANDRESYQYLVESIRKFPTQEEFTGMMKAQGFQVTGKGYEDLTFGVATIWSGWKL